MESLIYEITAEVREDLVPDFETYMNSRHIPDVLATGAFESCIFTRSKKGRYRISYRTGRGLLDGYLRDHAPRLRGHVVESFPEGVELSREEWSIISDHPK
jgi:hypothetical protein